MKKGDSLTIKEAKLSDRQTAPPGKPFYLYIFCLFVCWYKLNVRRIFLWLLRWLQGMFINGKRGKIWPSEKISTFIVFEWMYKLNRKLYKIRFTNKNVNLKKSNDQQLKSWLVLYNCFRKNTFLVLKSSLFCFFAFEKI